MVNRAVEPITPRALWNAPAWRAAPPLIVGRPMGAEPSHSPFTQAKLLYDQESIHIMFRVEDRYVRAAVTGYQGPVCTDSCVEFFFTPGPDLGAGYFNIEANCCGTLLFMHQQARGIDRVGVSETDARQLRVAHTLAGPIEREIFEPVSWCIEYQVPYSVLRGYAPVVTPAPGAAWRANLYKCGEETSHPHWLTWSPVDLPQPDFHRKEFFGELAFGG